MAKEERILFLMIGALGFVGAALRLPGSSHSPDGSRGMTSPAVAYI
jgi:hypothetical protein